MSRARIALLFATAALAASGSAAGWAQLAAKPAAAQAQPYPLSIFAQFPALERPRINTDGTAIAAKVRQGDEQVLALIPLDRPNARPVLIARDGEFNARDEMRSANWRWIDPDNLLITVVARTDLDGQNVDSSRLIAWNRKTGKRTLLGWEGTFVQGSDLLWHSRNGRPRILLGRLAAGRGFERLGNQEVVEVDVTSGRHEVVLKPARGVANWYADGAGNIRLGLSSDAETGKITALYRAGGSCPFRTIIRQKQERYSTVPIPLIFLPGEKAMVLSRHEGFNAVYELDLTTMDFGRKVFGVPGYDVDDVAANEADDALERVSVIKDRVEHHWFDERLKEIQTVIDETFGAGKAYIASADRPRQNIVVRVGGPDQAGAYYLFNTETGATRQIAWINNTLKDARLNPVRTVRYKARDGKEVSAVLTLPRLKPAKALPLIVLPHGGPWARDDESWDMWAQPLAELGYAVIQPNYRGSSGYGKAWEAMSDGNWGNAMSDDLDDSITYLASQGIADPKRVCIFGWSYGGYAAARAAQRNPDLYRCAIAGAGVYDLPKMTAYDRNYLGEYGSKYIGSAASRLSDVSPARHAGGKWAPILIVHGAKDQRVPVAQARFLVERLKAAGKVEGRDFIYIEQPRNTHNLPFEADRLQLLEEARKFLARHNPA